MYLCACVRACVLVAPPTPTPLHHPPQERNERLFFYVLAHHLEELLPLLTYPTVGEVCRRMSLMFRR